MDNIISKLRNLDAYPKINEDFYSRTLSGGVITLASSVVMILLFISELRRFPSLRFCSVHILLNLGLTIMCITIQLYVVSL